MNDKQTRRPGRLALGWGILTLAATFAGCSSSSEFDTDETGTLGQAGRVRFSYQRSCFFGCSLDQPLLSGARESIALSRPGDLEGLEVESEDEDVAEFAVERECYCERDDQHEGRLEISLDGTCEGIWSKRCDNQVLIRANGPGDTTLGLRTPEGSLIDRVAVHVEDAEEARFLAVFPDKLGSQPGESFEAETGTQFELNLDLLGQNGLKLLAPDAVSWRSLDPDIAQLSAFLVAPAESLTGGLSVTVDALAAGATEIEVDVPGVRERVTLDVFDGD
jgi:hypothetical protein